MNFINGRENERYYCFNPRPEQKFFFIVGAHTSPVKWAVAKSTNHINTEKENQIAML
jgi:hypothetical protein